MLARILLLPLALLVGCGESHVTMMGTDSGPPPVCEAPSVSVLVRSDYLPGTEVVSIVVELNDVVVDGAGVTASDDLAAGITLGPICGLRPNSRVTIRLKDRRGGDVDAGQVLVEDPMDGALIIIPIVRSTRD